MNAVSGGSEKSVRTFQVGTGEGNVGGAHEVMTTLLTSTRPPSRTGEVAEAYSILLIHLLIIIAKMASAQELRETAEQQLNTSTPQMYEVRERQQYEQPASSNRPPEATNAPTNEDYEPNPSASIQLSSERQHILDSVCRLYSGSAIHEEGSTGEQDMRVYAKKAVYDDVWSYCDTRYKIAGQWYGIPPVMKSTETKAVEVVSSTPIPEGHAKEPGAIVFKMKRAVCSTLDSHHVCL